MGYRSEVVMGFSNEEHMESTIKEFKKVLKQNALNDYFIEQEDCVYFKEEYIKWYEGVDPNIDKIMEFFDERLKQYGDDDCFFIRVGEEVGDCEIKGNPYLYGIGLRWGISFDV